MKGIIALDIDGTLTAEHNSTPVEVVVFLGELASQGWQLIFITGRTFQWGFKALKNLPFPYHLAVNNGALLLEMPARNIVNRKYLAPPQIAGLEPLCKREGTDFVLYGGYECGDLCYYRPQKFAPELLHYLQKRTEELGEKWQAVDTFEEVPLQEFAAAKCFARGPAAVRLSCAIEEGLGLHAPSIRDPYDSNYYVVQATHSHVSKGETVTDFKQLMGANVVIAAGDDNNDRSMLAHATIRIVMETAPAEMKASATIIAPPAKELGIIQGLKKAIELYDHRRV